MAGTHWKGPVFSQGMLLTGGGIPATFGNVWFVDYTKGSDSHSGKRMDQAFKTVNAAMGAATTNNNDVICLAAHSAAHTLADQLTITKNRLHFIGLDCSPTRYIGQRARISLGVTTGTAVAAIHNTGVGNTFTNLKIQSAEEGVGLLLLARLNAEHASTIEHAEDLFG
jgi:hypothetical protein